MCSFIVLMPSAWFWWKFPPFKCEVLLHIEFLCKRLLCISAIIIKRIGINWTESLESISWFLELLVKYTFFCVCTTETDEDRGSSNATTWNPLCPTYITVCLLWRGSHGGSQVHCSIHCRLTRMGQIHQSVYHYPCLNEGQNQLDGTDKHMIQQDQKCWDMFMWDEQELRVGWWIAGVGV